MEAPEDPLQLAKHGRALRALAQGILRDEHAADDAVQEAWLHVVRAGESEGPSIFQRLRGLVLRYARDRRRSEHARRFREERHSRERTARFSDAERSEVDRSFSSAETVTRALAALPRPAREVLWLRFYEDMGPAEMAGRLGLPLETVRARLRRAVATLRSEVKLRLENEGRSLQALLPLAGFGLSSTPTSSAVTATGSIGGVLLMKKWILASIVILVGLVWVDRSRKAIQVAALDASVVAPNALTPPLERDTRPRAELQPVASKVQRLSTSAPRREKVMHASTPQDSVTMRVTVRDQAASQLVPFYSFVAKYGGTSHELRSDMNGICELDVPSGERVELVWGTGVSLSSMGTLRRMFVGSMLPVQPGTDPEVVLDATVASFTEVWESTVSGEIEIAVAVGPTWLLELDTLNGDPLPSLSELEAQLIYSSAGLHAAPAEEIQREGEILWVRFPELLEWKEFDTSVLDLRVRRADGLAEGKTTVVRRAGFTQRPLEIFLEPRCAVRGRVFDEKGVVIQGVTVGAQAPGQERAIRDTTGANGVYEMSHLESGLWTIYVADPAYEPVQKSVTLRDGVVEHLDLPLRRKPGGGTISGEITSRSGLFEGWVFLFLEGTADTAFWRRADPEFESTAAGNVARFKFEDVPPGEYRLICNTDQPVQVLDRVRLLEPPAHDLRFVLLDDVQPRKISVSATAVENEETLNDHTLRIVVGGGYADIKKGTAESPATADVAPGSSFTWTVSSPGRRPVIGNESDLEGDEIRVAMEPGFGAWFHFLDVESLNDLEGVEVFADGKSLGRTNHQGELFASWPQRPKRIHFDENEWLVHHSVTYRSEIDAESGALLVEDGEPSIYAYLRRAR